MQIHWIITSRGVNNKVLSSVLQVQNLLLKQVKVKIAVRESVQSLYKVIMWSCMTWDNMTTYTPSYPALLITQLPQLYALCLMCCFNLEGIVLLPGWNIPICVEIFILSCLTLVTMSLLLWSSYRQKQTGAADASSNLSDWGVWNLKMQGGENKSSSM